MLADVIGRELPDFSALNDHRMPHLFVCATNVKTNRRKIFGPGELGADALTASACLPTIFRSVEVNGNYYWDGGYLGNPALSPEKSRSAELGLHYVAGATRMRAALYRTDTSDLIAFDTISMQAQNIDMARSPAGRSAAERGSERGKSAAI